MRLTPERELMIDLRSDTMTKPTPAMKQAMIEAEVGDDMWGEDPTVNRLESMVADLLGMEATVFTCSATQANQIGVRVHCVPGDELLINSTGHIGIYEAGAPAALSGVSVRQIESPRGMLRVEDLEGRPRPDDQHFCRTRLVCLENTTNLGGGHAYSLEQLGQVSDWARQHGLKIHLDGARLFNACLAAGYAARDVAACADTVSICFSKGLGCPMGAVLAGSAEDIRMARRVRKMLGGAMRQVGIVAAAAVFALENNIDRLQEDHDNARTLAKLLSRIPGLTGVQEQPQTNLVFFEVDAAFGSAADLVSALERRGVLVGAMYGQQLRAVTHLDVSAADIDRAAREIAECLDGSDSLVAPGQPVEQSTG